jgi:hypothetical protein
VNYSGTECIVNNREGKVKTAKGHKTKSKVCRTLRLYKVRGIRMTGKLFRV